MTFYTAYEPASLHDARVAHGLTNPLALAGLDAPARSVLEALFEADGATPETLRERLGAQRETVERALGTLKRMGYVEREGASAWLTGEAFGLRRAVRRAGARVAFRGR